VEDRFRDVLRVSAEVPTRADVPVPDTVSYLKGVHFDVAALQSLLEEGVDLLHAGNSLLLAG
jgi:hypothetical protein